MRKKGAWCHSRFNKHKKDTEEVHPRGMSGIREATSSSMMELLKA